MRNERIIIVGGPRRGKSTLARRLSEHWIPTRDVPARQQHPVFCGDPLSKAKEPLRGVEYLPEGIPFGGDLGAAQWIADHWFPMPGPWICEGHVMARALRRWLDRIHRDSDGKMSREPRQPADRIMVLDRPAWVESSKGQEAMHRAVMTVWRGIAPHFEAITEYR